MAYATDNTSVNMNTVVSDATKSWTKEDHIDFLRSRVEARQRRMKEMVQSMVKMQDFNKRDLLRIEELRILRDIRDGKLTLVHSASGQAMNVHVYQPN